MLGILRACIPSTRGDQDVTARPWTADRLRLVQMQPQQQAFAERPRNCTAVTVETARQLHNPTARLFCFLLLLLLPTAAVVTLSRCAFHQLG